MSPAKARPKPPPAAQPKAHTVTVNQRNGRSLTAAVQILNGPRIKRVAKAKNSTGLAWQQEGWAYYDEIPEYARGVDKLAWAVSQVRLVAARDVPGVDEPEIVDGKPAKDGSNASRPLAVEKLAAELVGGFAGGSTGQQQIMYRIATQLIVAAESYVVGRTIRHDDRDDEERWETYSNDEVKYSASGWGIDDGVEKYDLSPDDVLIRVWLPHARRRQEPRSSTKALLPVLAEIRALTMSISAQAESRLAGNGILILPESMKSLGGPSDDVEDGDDPFVAELMDAMVTPISNRDSAAAVVPIVVTVADEAIGKAQHLKFFDAADTKDVEKRDAAMVRLARGMDLAQEEILGMGEANHWTGWLIAESTVQGPVAALVSVIVHCMTIGWFRPALEAAGVASDVANDYLTWYDLTPLAQRPDRSEQALQVYDRGGLSLEALLRESGFDDADAPQDGELCKQLLLQLVKVHPELAPQLLDRLGLCAGIGSLADLQGETVKGEVVDSTEQVERRDARELPEDDGPPAVTSSAAQEVAPGEDCLLLAANVAVMRALEVAGKRMRGMRTRAVRAELVDSPAHLVHTLMPAPKEQVVDQLLEGAWTALESSLPDRPELAAELDGYVRALLASGQPHEMEWLRPIIRRCCS